MGLVISIANQKGGVGKTTSVFNLGVTLAERGFKTLMIDLDPYASLTQIAGLYPYAYANCIVSALRGLPVTDCIQQNIRENADIVTSRFELEGDRLKMFNMRFGEFFLRNAIEPIRNRYDYILIDCPSEFSVLNVNALTASDYVIMTVKTDYLSYCAVKNCNKLIMDAQKSNPTLRKLGIIATLYSKSAKTHNEILELMQIEYNVFAVVRDLVVVDKGTINGLAAFELEPNSDVSKAYNVATDHIIEKTWSRVS